MRLGACGRFAGRVAPFCCYILYGHFCFFICLFCLCFFFFFSSRRRHTRSLRDWSSDVCSSDLKGSAERVRHVRRVESGRRRGVVEKELRRVLAKQTTTADDNCADWRIFRSEEHTSELQSRRDLVCRLLLEKKKKKNNNTKNRHS